MTDNRPRPRQAVVIIHGIGEQRPMDTLRSFVTGVVGKRQALSKPDHISPTLELRRMAVPSEASKWSPGQPVSTDFYELYWAHLMEGTSWNHLTAWMRMLMLRWPWRVPSRLRPFWILTWLIAAAAGAALYGPWRPNIAQWPLIAAVVAGAVAIAKSTGSYFGLQFLGDAARYLSPIPPNIGVRHAIRSAALDLLRGLHDDPVWHRYHRIIVVGHSLGSVVGYDMLTYLWQERHHPTDHLRWAPQPAHDRLGESLSLAEGRNLQSRIWREQRAIGVQWNITDFITLGSPLAHAPFLMAKDQDDFNERKRQREFPSCPPRAEDDRDRDYGQSLLDVQPVGAEKSCRLLHHGALFACTRWTNLYFPNDRIGGSLRDLFGDWICEPSLQSRYFFSHTRYWNADEPALEQLKKSLDLDGWWTAENAEAALDAHARDHTV
jgi:hypothetical protein